MSMCGNCNNYEDGKKEAFEEVVHMIKTIKEVGTYIDFPNQESFLSAWLNQKIEEYKE